MRAGAGAAASLTETGSDAATLPGGGEPSAVKSDCCCANVLRLTGCAVLRRIIIAGPFQRRAKATQALGVSVLVARVARPVCSPTHRWIRRVAAGLAATTTPRIVARPECRHRAASLARSNRWPPDVARQRGVRPGSPCRSPSDRRRSAWRDTGSAGSRGECWSPRTGHSPGPRSAPFPKAGEGKVPGARRPALPMMALCSHQVLCQSCPTASSTRTKKAITPRPPLGA